MKNPLHFPRQVAIMTFAPESIRRSTIHGAIAQLVARYIRIVEATGSTPVSSTTKTFSKEKVFCFM